MARSIAKECLRFTGLFEAELLTELLLRYWEHPHANDPEFRSALLESAARVLRASIAGQHLFEDLAPQNVNFVAAIWYAESVSVDERGEMSSAERRKRVEWLEAVTRAIPSCFCNPEFLE